MKYRFLTSIFIVTLSLCLLTGCNNKPETDQEKPNVEASTENVISNKENEENKSQSEPSKIESPEKQLEKLTTETLLQTKNNAPDEKTKTYTDAYLNYINNKNGTNIEVKEPKEIMMKSYSENVTTEILNQTDTEITLKITSPNFATLVDKAIEELSTQGNYETKAVESRINDYIAANEYEINTYEVVVNYTENNGEIIIEESFEYLDAIYGGMLSSAKEKYAEYKASSIEEVEAID